MQYTSDEIYALFDPVVAQDAVHTPQGGAASNIKVIFNNAHQTIEMLGGGVGVESTNPSALCKTSDVSATKHGDTLAISGKTYYIIGVQPDGAGITRLILSENQNA
jgi:hypothetical protein